MNQAPIDANGSGPRQRLINSLDGHLPISNPIGRSAFAGALLRHGSFSARGCTSRYNDAGQVKPHHQPIIYAGPRGSVTINLLTLRLLVLAAEHKSLSKTAQIANLALAAVSRRIINLEADLGIPLFKRTRSGVELTPAGEVCLQRAEKILEEVSQLKLDMADFQSGMRGRVSIRASTSAVAQFLPEDLAAFEKLHAGIRLRIREAYSADIVSELRLGQLDVGIILEGGETFGLNTWPYRKDRLVVVAPATFRPDIHSMRFDEVLDEDMIQMGFDTAMTKLLSARANDAGRALRLRVEVDSFDAVCRMVAAGFGIGILPRIAAESPVNQLDLRLIELDEPWAERLMLICVKDDKPPSNPAREVIDFLVACAAKDNGLPSGSEG